MPQKSDEELLEDVLSLVDDYYEFYVGRENLIDVLSNMLSDYDSSKKALENAEAEVEELELKLQDTKDMLMENGDW